MPFTADLANLPSRDITGRTRTYTNADVAKHLPQDMHPPDVLDNSEDVMDDIPSPPDILDDTEDTPPITRNITAISDEEPGTYWGGVKKFLTAKDPSRTAGLEGLKGYAKGAITDLPASVVGMIKSGYNLVTDPINTIKGIPSDLSDMAKHIGKTTMEAGGKPEEFGRMMGQITGQPLVTEGIIKGAPAATRLAGYPTEMAGSIMRKYQPITGMPVASTFAGRNLRNLERGVGRRVESLGSKMKEVGKVTTIDGKITSGTENFPEGETIPNEKIVAKEPTTSKITKRVEEIINEDNNSSTKLDKRPMRERIKEIEGLPDYYYKSPSELVEGQELPRITDSTRAAKPKVRLLNDGTYLNYETGEILDSQGNPMASPTTPNKTESIIPKTKEPYTIKNAPPNQRAKIMRGMHDPVDVLFEDPLDRDIFGSGQRMSMGKSESTNSAISQRFIQASNRIAKDYNLTPEQARGAVLDYNKMVREIAKSQAKYGDNLNFKAPSFSEFMSNQR